MVIVIIEHPFICQTNTLRTAWYHLLEFGSGARMLIMFVLKPIPLEIVIVNFKMSVEYSGQRRHSSVCQSFGHPTRVSHDLPVKYSGLSYLTYGDTTIPSSEMIFLRKVCDHHSRTQICQKAR